MGKREKVKTANKKQEIKKVNLEKEEKPVIDNSFEEEQFVHNLEEEIGAEDQIETKKNLRIKTIEKTLETLETNEKNNGVIYVGHLPWGFEDRGIKKYFEQFGKISRILVPKSKKTGRVKGYAFVEFEDRDVADIAAKTMNNYILFDKILKCSVVEDTSRYNLIFKKWKRQFKFNDKYKTYLKEKNKFKTKEEVKEHIKLLLEKEDQKRKKLAELGIKYEFPGYSAILEKNNAASEIKKPASKKNPAKNKKIK